MFTASGEQPDVGVKTALAIGFAKTVVTALAVSLQPNALVEIKVTLKVKLLILLFV